MVLQLVDNNYKPHGVRERRSADNWTNKVETISTFTTVSKPVNETAQAILLCADDVIKSAQCATNTDDPKKTTLKYFMKFSNETSLNIAIGKYLSKFSSAQFWVRNDFNDNF